jgi:hypothetical protein
MKNSEKNLCVLSQYKPANVNRRTNGIKNQDFFLIKTAIEIIKRAFEKENYENCVTLSEW